MSSWRHRRTNSVASCIAPLHDMVFVRGEGTTVYDEDGQAYQDFTGGLGVLLLGYGHPRILAAIERQARALVHSSFPTMPSAPYIEMAERLCEIVGAHDAKYKCALFNSGAEAIENAAKICRWTTGRPAFLTVESGFHGRSWAALALTFDSVPFKQNLGELGLEVHSLPLALVRGPDVITNPERALTADLEEDEYLASLEAYAAEHFDPARIGGLFVEPVLGNSGVIAVAPMFLRAAARFCRRHGILLVADEIQSGLGRTGVWFTANAYGVRPDLIIAGKALGGGLPLSAVIGRADVMDSLHRGALGSTGGGNPVACAAGCALLAEIAEHGLLRRAGAISVRCLAALAALDELQIPLNVRIVGSMVAVEFQELGRASSGATLSEAVLQLARDRRLLLLRGGGRRSFVRMLPPLSMTDDDLDAGLSTFVASIVDSVAALSVDR